MAKPKVYKVADYWRLVDLVSALKVSDLDKVCFVVPKQSSGRRKRWRFVKGTLRFYYKTYCECCGPELHAWVEKADGTKVVPWS
jgi:hypothetical protein